MTTAAVPHKPIIDLARVRKYKITPDSLSSQVKDMDHKDLFAIQQTITSELDRRRAEVARLAEELKGGAKG